MIMESLTQKNLVRETDLLLGKLPPELADRWDEENENKTPEERLQNILAFVDRREKSRRGKRSLETNPERTSTHTENPRAIVKFIRNLEKGQHDEIGSGKAARVIASLRKPEVCYKVMFPADIVPPETNAIEKETDLQKEISDLGEKFGVRVPKVYYFIDNSAMRAIAMERLDAITLRDALAGREKVPKNFNGKTFYTALEKYMRMLHKEGFYHRDLHEGNVMIDNQTGMPRVIDFGASIHTKFADQVYRKTVIKNGREVNIVLPSDSGSLEALRYKIREKL